MSRENEQVYRASVAAMLFNSRGEILLVQNIFFKPHEWDFLKGGMEFNENHIDTLEREISEEVGDDIKYEIVKQSDLQIIYDWSDDLILKRKKRGQARTSFWVKYISGELKIDTNELRQIKWVDIEEFKILLKQTEFTDFQIKSLVEEFNDLIHP